MNAHAHVRVEIRKELTALMPVWAPSALAIVMASVISDAWMSTVSLLAFVLGSLVVGAHAIGHEYTHRTLAVLLTQPGDRRRLLATKAGVVAPMLLALLLLAWLTLFRDPRVLRTVGWTDFPAPFLISLAALCVAPWLTMLCRSTMAAVVFTFAISPMLLVLGNLAGGLKYGTHAAAPIDRLTAAIHFWGVLAWCTVGAVAGWRTFMRLEVVEGTGRQFHLSLHTTARPRARARHWILALIAKELRLQQLTVVLFGLFAAGCTAVLLAPQVFETASRALIPLMMLYTALLSILIGSLAIAEERQFGTMDLQLLMPVAIWKQWLVKAGVAFALAATLGILVPQLMGVFLPVGPVAGSFAMWRSHALLVLVLTSTSLYISSLSSSGVRAAVMSVPAIFALMLLVQIVSLVLRRAYRSPFHMWVGSMIPAHLRDEVLRAVAWIPLTVAALVALTMLWLAFRNYRDGQRTVRRIAVQGLCVAAVVVLVLAAQFLVAAVALR